RYRGIEHPCFLKKISNEDIFEIEFKEVVPRSSPGQSAVVYYNEFVIGGGIIAENYPSFH
ncbi:MAG: tRNA 2-thiouridine(34) synthase MnmA, partial [Actinomycetia bacterium]|nr:tRNA 2-thiouridine(34) synthase MnmA [Actinomycetes bacterium]